MKYFLYILIVSVACAYAQATTPAGSNILKDPSFENYPKKDLDKQNFYGPAGKGIAGWAIYGEAVILSNALSPSSPTPYGQQFVRFQNYTGTGENKVGGFIQQRLNLPTKSAKYTTTLRYRITQAPQSTCFLSIEYNTKGETVYMGEIFFIKPGSTSSTWKSATFSSSAPLTKAKRGGNINYFVSCNKNPGAWIFDVDDIALFTSGSPS